MRKFHSAALQVNFSLVEKTDPAFLVSILMAIVRCVTSY